MNRLTRSLAALPLASMLILGGGCEDQRGPTEVPDTGALDGDVVFGSAAIIVSVYEMFNDFAQRCLDLADAGTPLPVTLSGCEDSGTAIITDNGDSDPLSFRVSFSLFQAACDTELPISIATDVDLEAAMIITFTETSPGLRYTIELPVLQFPSPGAPLPIFAPTGIKVQTPTQVGVTFDVTTVKTDLSSGDFVITPLEFVLNGTRAAGGSVSMAGPLRWEDFGASFSLVQDVDLEFAYSEANETYFAPYPSGSYQIASFGTVGGGGFGGGVGSGLPVTVSFNGSGGLEFQVTGRDCEGNLTTGFNSCDD